MSRPLSVKIGEEVINELITVGLSFILVLFTVNYFNFKYAWIELLRRFGEMVGLTAGSEMNVMVDALAGSFPLKYIFADYSFGMSIFVGIVVLALAIFLKTLLKEPKEKWLMDMGRNLYIPAIVIFVCMLVLQVLFAIKASVLVGGSAGSVFVWEIFGLLFIVGIVTLITGSVLKAIAHNRKSPIISLIANTILDGSIILLVYYLIIRLLTLKWVLASSLGKFFEVFILSGELSVYVIILSVFLFTFGRQLYDFGKFLARVRRKRERSFERPMHYPSEV